MSTSSGTLSKRQQRLAVGSFFFFHGLCFSSWGARIPAIQQKIGLSEAELGAVLLAVPAGLMLSMPLAGALVARLGSRKVLTISIIAYAALLVSLGLAANTAELVTALFVFGLASNLVNISVNTQAVGVEGLYHKPIMASFHGLWSLAGFFGAAIGTVMIGANIIPTWHFALILLLVAGGALLCSKKTIEKDSSSEEKQPLFVLPDRALLNLGLIAFCSMICEGAMFDWSGVYFKKVVGAENAWIGAGYTAFMSTMASSRFIADSFTHRFGLKRTLQLSGVLTATGLMISVLFPHLVTAMIGFLFVGAGVSSVVPSAFSAAGRASSLPTSLAIAAVSTIGFLGFLIGPPLIGLVAGATSLRISFSIIAVMGLCITILATRARKL